MKQLIILIQLFIFISITAIGQTPDWNTSGNTLLNYNFLGSINQQPLRIRTQNISRMYLNRDIATSVNGQPNIDRSGFMGLGRNYGTINNWNDVAGNPAGGPLF